MLSSRYTVANRHTGVKHCHHSAAAIHTGVKLCHESAAAIHTGVKHCRWSAAPNHAKKEVWMRKEMFNLFGDSTIRLQNVGEQYLLFKLNAHIVCI